MNKEMMKMIQGYLTWWMMYSFDSFEDRKIYDKKKEELMSYYEDVEGIKFFIKNLEDRILNSSIMNEFFKIKNVPKLYFFNLKEKPHEKFIC